MISKSEFTASIVTDSIKLHHCDVRNQRNANTSIRSSSDSCSSQKVSSIEKLANEL